MKGLNAKQVVNLLSGVLFILAGLVLVLNVRYPIRLEGSTALGLILIIVGVSMAFKVPFANALILGISIATLIFALNGFNVDLGGRGTVINGTLEEGRSFEVEVNAGKLNLKVGDCEKSTYRGAVLTYSLYNESLKFTGKMDLTLCKAKRIKIDVKAGTAKVEIDRCLEKVNVENEAGTVKVIYNVPSKCGGTISVENNLGSAYLKIKIPKGVKVIYSVSSTLGKAELVTPEGVYTGSGTWGEGEETLYLRLESNLGTLTAVIEK